MAKQKITIDDLARMVQNGFMEMRDATQKIVKNEVDSVRQEVFETKKENKKHFAFIEQGIEDVKLRQDNVAYRFELNALGERVTKLEKTR